MPIIVQLDIMLARRKLKSKDLAEQVGMTEANLSLLKQGKVKGVRFDTLEKICTILQCQPGDLLVYEATNHGSIRSLISPLKYASSRRIYCLISYLINSKTPANKLAYHQKICSPATSS